MTRITRRLEPQSGSRDPYDATYDAYRRLHPAIAPIIRDLAGAVAS